MGAVHAVPGRAAACPWARVCTHTQLCAGRRTTAAPWPINTYVREQCRGPVLVFWAHISPWFVWERCGSELGSIRRSCAAFRVGLLLDGVGLRVLFSAPVPTGEPKVAVGRSELFFWFAAGRGAGNDSPLPCFCSWITFRQEGVAQRKGGLEWCLKRYHGRAILELDTSVSLRPYARCLYPCLDQAPRPGAIVLLLNLSLSRNNMLVPNLIVIIRICPTC